MSSHSHTKLDTESVGFLVLTLMVMIFYGALCVWINRLLLARNDYLRSGDGYTYFHKNSNSSGLPGSKRPQHSEGSALLSPSAVMSGSLPSGSNMPLPSNQKKYHRRKHNHHHGRGAGGTALNSASPTVGSSSNGTNSASHSKVALVLEDEEASEDTTSKEKTRARSESQPLPSLSVAAPLIVEGPGTAYEDTRTQGRSASVGGKHVGSKLEDPDDASNIATEVEQKSAASSGMTPTSILGSGSVTHKKSNHITSPRGGHHQGGGVVALPRGVDLEDDETMVQMAADRLVQDQQEALINPRRLFSDHICQMYLVALGLCLYSLTLSICLMLNTPSDSILATKQTRRETNSVESDWVTLPMATLLYAFILTLVLTIYESVGVSSKVRTRDTVMVFLCIAIYLVSTSICLILGGDKLEEVAMCIDAAYSFSCCILCLIFARKLPPRLRFNNLRMLANNTEATLGFNAALFFLRGGFFIPPVQKDLLPSRIEDTLPILMLLNCMPIIFTIVIMRSNRQPRTGGVS